MKSMVLILSVFLFSMVAQSGVVSYMQDTSELEGYLAKPSKNGKMPAAIIIHDWMGPSEYTSNKAEEMAKLGYVALAADIYGKGNRPKDAQEAGAFAGKYKGDRKLFRARLTAAYDYLKKQPNVDPKKIVVFGYCFGGTGALELARSGAELAGVVSFHGGLDNPTPLDAKNIKAKVLVLHGAIDPYVPQKEIDAFQKEMNEAGIDYQFVSYSGAVHAFTNPKAGSDIKAGAAYNEAADKRSWIAFQSFLKEVIR